MDLPVSESVDIYQIHRTPFFRRLHRKDSDEFERLKKAYESVRNFDEKPLQAQVKKIRLGKLLRRIKDTFTNSNKMQALNKGRTRPKSKQQVRREELAKARQIGMDYSRQNLNSPLSITPEKRNPLEDWQREKSRLERRLEYGNTKSQVNRKKIQNLQALHTQKLPDDDVPPLKGAEALHLSPSATKQRLVMLKKNLTKKEFMKFLAHCLSADKPNPQVMKAFEEILQSKNDLYWDLVEAIDQRQQYIKRYGKFMKKLSNLALKGVPEVKPVKTRAPPPPPPPEPYMEEFQSKTNIKPTRKLSPEVFVRTYRYTDEDQYLPPPSESLLRIPESIKALDIHHHDGFREPPNTPASTHIGRKSSSHLSARLLKSMRTDPSAKCGMSRKFGEIIRDTVRKESAVMLGNLEKALKH